MTSFFAARSACTPLAAEPSCSRLSTAACCRAACTAASRSAAASNRTAAIASSTAAYTSSDTVDADADGPRDAPATSQVTAAATTAARSTDRTIMNAMMREGCHSERGWAGCYNPGDGRPRACAPDRAPAPRRCCSPCSASWSCPTAARCGRRRWCARWPCSTSRSATPARPSPASPPRARVRSEKDGRRARWHLTDAGRRLLVEGTTRIYELGAGDDRWDGRWLVVLCSVPEEQRAKRHQLRTQLEFAGFGFLAPGVAVSPHLDREGPANAVLAELGLLPGAMVFRAEAGDLVEADDLLARAWDLDTLADVLHRLRRRVRGSGSAHRRGPLRGPRRAGPRVAALPVHGPRHPGPPAPTPLARPNGPRRLHRAPRRLVARRDPLVARDRVDRDAEALCHRTSPRGLCGDTERRIFDKILTDRRDVVD